MADCLSDYLKAIGGIPLLREEEELELGRMIREWRDFENIASVKQRRGRRAFVRMVNGNLRLVVSVVKQYRFRIKGNSIDMMDLVQAGNLGLMRAVEKFDPTRGYRFSTYGYWWIKQSAIRFIQDSDCAIKVPRSLVALKSKVDRLKDMGSSCKDVDRLEGEGVLQARKVERARLLSFYNKMISLDQCIGGIDTGELTLKDSIPGCCENQVKDDYLWIQQYLRLLSPEEQEVISYRFYVEKRMAFIDIAKSTGKTKHHIQSVERRALKKLRRAIEPALHPA
jgi:RNA polymerase sigma factor (sigma-70 family)